jgi:hypothetical protein
VVVAVAALVVAALGAVAATAAVALVAVATAAALVVAATEDLDRDPVDQEPPVVRAHRVLREVRAHLVIREDRVALTGRVVLVTRVGLVVLAAQGRVALVVLVTRVGQVILVSPVGLAIRATQVDPLDITATTAMAGTTTSLTTPTSTTTISMATTASGAGSARGATMLAVASGVPRGATDPHPGVRARRRHRPGTNHFPRRVDSGLTAQSTTGDSTKRLLGTHSSTSGASTSSESGSRCRGPTLTREVARSLSVLPPNRAGRSRRRSAAASPEAAMPRCRAG